MIQFALIALAAMYAMVNFPPMDRQFERCRADWLAAFKPPLDRRISELDADYQFIRSCMASKGFTVKSDPCPAGQAMTYSNCYVRRLPWD